jgi:hypothetical protein
MSGRPLGNDLGQRDTSPIAKPAIVGLDFQRQ